MLRSLITGLLVVCQACLLLQSASAQSTPLSIEAAAVKRQVSDSAIGGKLTVNMRDGKEYYGNLSSIESESFTIREVDLKQTLTLRYQDVEKVRKDYGRRGFTGRRIHPRKRLITGLIIVGPSITLVVVAVASDQS